MLRAGRRGQALVEFSLAILVVLVLVMGVVDFGMAIYKFNGVSQAAREIARVTSVHPCAGAAITCDPGAPPSAETQAVIDVQKGLIPGLDDPTFECVDAAGATVSGPCNFAVHSVKVTIIAPYQPATPLLGLTGTWNMEGTSSAQIHS